MSLAIVPGSFDPMTMGHLSLIRKVAKTYDEVVVAVMINSSKQCFLDLETRVKIAKKTVSDLPNVRVISDRGMLIDLFDRIGATAVCKGWRNATDYAYEVKMAEWNKSHNPRFRTELYQSEGEYATLSSTEVRTLLEEGNLPEGLVHPDALPILTAAIKK